MVTRRFRKGVGEWVFDGVVYAFVTLFCVLCLIPFLLILGSSFEAEKNIIKYGFTLFPREFSANAYSMVLKDSIIYKSYGITIFITVVGTLTAMILTILLAYPLSVKKVRCRNGIMFSVYFTMLFSGGLVPIYLLISKSLGMADTVWAMIIPYAFSAWNMILLRNFFNSVPAELAESAYIDGANDLTILVRIILPVSIPGIATIGLFYALGFWNQWFPARLYITNRKDLYPLQYLLMTMMDGIESMRQMAMSSGTSVANLPQYSLRVATTIITIGPIVFLYPFALKYFTSGLTIGAIKG